MYIYVHGKRKNCRNSGVVELLPKTPFVGVIEAVEEEDRLLDFASFSRLG
jgi:hypothetical protein